MNDSISSTSTFNPNQARIVSVDALRGFDMFWIIGGEQVAEALEKFGGGVVSSTIAHGVYHSCG